MTSKIKVDFWKDKIDQPLASPTKRENKNIQYEKEKAQSQIPKGL